MSRNTSDSWLTFHISLAVISRGIRFPSSGYFSSMKYHCFPSFMANNLPPSPLAASLMSMRFPPHFTVVGWYWIISPFARGTPSRNNSAVTSPVLLSEPVVFPNNPCIPPVATITASPGNSTVSWLYSSLITQPQQILPHRRSVRKEWWLNRSTIPDASFLRTASIIAVMICFPVSLCAKAVRFFFCPPKFRRSTSS